MTGKKLVNLPESNDEYWEGAEKYQSKPIKLSICDDHARKDWMNHIGYKDNGDGTLSCKICSWGCRIPGYIRVVDDRVVDLRKL